MSLEQTVTAIVLSRKDSGESDRRLTILTPEYGKIEVIAKGARKSGSRFSSSSEPLAHSKMQLAAGKQRTFVTQSVPLRSFSGLRTNFDRLSAGLALTELYASVLPTGQPETGAFELLLDSLAALDEASNPFLPLLWAELKLLELEGVAPQFEFCVVSGDRIGETPAWVSPTAGGYVRPFSATDFSDRYQAAVEVLISLARTLELPAAPPSLKLWQECLAALFPFLLHIAQRSLPAGEHVINLLRTDHLPSES